MPSPAQVIQTLLANPLDLAIVKSLTTPDVTYVSLSEDNPELKRYLPWTGTNQGPESIVRAFEGIGRAWETKAFEVREVMEQGDKVAMFGTFTYRGRESGQEITSPFSLLAKVTEGRIHYLQFLEDTFGTSGTLGRPHLDPEPAPAPTEAADRLAIRELVEAYAHCADRRDAKGQMALFTADTHFVVYMDAKDPTPSQELHSREALAPVFADLNQYAATMHFVGQSTILALTGDRATGETYTLAHHLTIDSGKRRLMIAALRYNDTFVKTGGAWLFAERLLYVDWLEERALS
jgi:ketosteroid isomerase-like protein